jgi:hypothetical protein
LERIAASIVLRPNSMKSAQRGTAGSDTSARVRVETLAMANSVRGRIQRNIGTILLESIYGANLCTAINYGWQRVRESFKSQPIGVKKFQ